jgi:hypothetical protein
MTHAFQDAGVVFLHLMQDAQQRRAARPGVVGISVSLFVQKDDGGLIIIIIIIIITLHFNTKH